MPDPENSSKQESKGAKVVDPLRFSGTVSIVVTPIKYWAALSIVACSGVLGWALLGRIPEKVSGEGVISKPFKIATVSQSGYEGGVITEIYVKPGSIVKRGEIVAKVRYPAQEEKVKSALNDLKIAEAEHKRQYSSNSYVGLLAQQKQSIQSSEDYLQAAVELQKSGVISKTTVRSAKQSYENAIQDLLSSEDEVIRSNANLAKLKAELEAARATRTVASDIKTDYPGKVLNVFVNIGQKNEPSGELLQMEILSGEGKETWNEESPLSVIAYFSPLQAAKLKKGQEVHVLPSNILPNTYGFILGRVQEVSILPVTKNEASGLLGSNALADSLVDARKTIQVIIGLVPDRRSHTGYKWINGSGPPSDNPALFPRIGLLADVSVITKRVPPITIGIPATKKFFGIDG